MLNINVQPLKLKKKCLSYTEITIIILLLKNYSKHLYLLFEMMRIFNIVRCTIGLNSINWIKSALWDYNHEHWKHL